MNPAAPSTDTLTALLSRAVARHPDRTFLEFNSVTYTYGDIDRESTSVAHGLTSLGIARGETVATMLDNSVDAVLAWIAINKIGAIVVPLNTALKGEYLRAPLRDSACNLLIAENHYAERVIEVAGMLPNLRTVLWRGGDSPRAMGQVQSIPLNSARTASAR
jgi:crotonobetaine/carnitine-CoA ligase